MRVIVHAYKKIEFDEECPLTQKQKRECAKNIAKGSLKDFEITHVEIRDQIK